MVGYFDKMFQLGTQLALAVNYLDVLGVSLASKQQNIPQVPTHSDGHLDHSVGQINNLVQSLATAVACIVALATVGSRHVACCL